MEIKIITEELQEMLNKAIKGVSNNKLLPITSLIAVEKKGNKLSLVTTDGSNRLEVFRNGMSFGVENFYAVVKAETLHKLIAKITTSNIVLKINANFLEIEGNGKYKIEIPIDADGKPVIFPTQPDNFSPETVQVKLGGLKTYITINKTTLAKSFDDVLMSNFYLGDTIITTDSYKASVSPAHVFDTPKLLPSEIVQLLLLNEDDTIQMQTNGTELMFTGSEIIIYGKETKDIERYPATNLKEMLEKPSVGTFTLNRMSLIDTLDRLATFTTQYSHNAIELNFNGKVLNVKSTDGNGIETITPSRTPAAAECICGVNIISLRAMLIGLTSELITIGYGDGGYLIIKSDDIVQILALVNLDRV